MGSARLPVQVRIVAAANPADRSAGGVDVAAPTANRFVHIDCEPTVDEWRTGIRTGCSLPASRAVAAGELRAASQTIVEYLMTPLAVVPQAADSSDAGTGPRVVLTASNSPHAVASVRHGPADLGVAEHSYAPVGLASCVVGHDDLVVVVLPDHQWAQRERVASAHELAQTPLICCEPRSGIRDPLTVALHRVLGDDMQQSPPFLELPSTRTIRAAVLAGAAPGAISRLAVADDVAVGRLRAIAFSELDLRRAFRAIWPGGRTPPAGAIKSLLSNIGRSTTTFTN